jgi:hypothetical protein
VFAGANRVTRLYWTEVDVRLLKNSLMITMLSASFALAQDAGHADHQHSTSTDQPSHDMEGMNMSETADWMPSPHASSGTSWQPASVPAHLWSTKLGTWDFMAHGVIFIDYNQQGGPRGAGKAESVNWAMLMEQHSLWGGSILFREMFSAESLTAPHPGFPLLFQTGETYHGEPLVDHQHPHNVFAELALNYTHPISEDFSWLFYGGIVGEPALGPPTYIHRASAAELPEAPLSHHLQDSTHTSFGVITSGFVLYRLKLEASAFNGREPNEQRYTIQPDALDSWSLRASVAPTKNWTAQYSYGRLEHPEALEAGSEMRQSASIEYVHPLERGSWATSAIWGRKHKIIDDRVLNSYLLESTLNFKRQNYLLTRLELVDKDELFPNDPVMPTFRIGAYTFGAARDLFHEKLWQLAVGADATFYSKPSSLDASYGTNPVSFQIFVRVRPGLSHHAH